MSYTLAAAAAACGVNKSTVLRVIKAGKISGTKDEHGEWHIEAAELHRVYPPVAAAAAGNGARCHGTNAGGTVSNGRARGADRGVAARAQLADALAQRDRWMTQAERLAALPEPTPKPEPMTWWRWLRSTG